MKTIENTRRAAEVATEAAHAARARIIELHSDEYDAICVEERVKRGLPPTPETMISLKKRVAELEKQLNGAA